MLRDIVVDILFALNKPIWGINSNLPSNLSTKDKVFYLKSWILGDVVVIVVLFLLSKIFNI